jgi:hypothetical protein
VSYCDFPDNLKINVKDKKTLSPIPDIAVFLKLFARLKNDYSILLPISGPNGEIFIEKEWVEEEVQKTRNLFIMDYSSTLDDCDHIVELKVLSGEEIRRAIEEMRIYNKVGIIDEEEIDNLTNAQNALFKPILKRVDVRKQNYVEFLLEPETP